MEKFNIDNLNDMEMQSNIHGQVSHRAGTSFHAVVSFVRSNAYECAKIVVGRWFSRLEKQIYEKLYGLFAWKSTIRTIRYSTNWHRFFLLEWQFNAPARMLHSFISKEMILWKIQDQGAFIFVFSFDSFDFVPSFDFTKTTLVWRKPQLIILILIQCKNESFPYCPRSQLKNFTFELLHFILSKRMCSMQISPTISLILSIADVTVQFSFRTLLSKNR